MSEMETTWDGVPVARERPARELCEETGWALAFVSLPEAAPSENVALYVAHAQPNAEIVLDHEHDRFLWLRLEEAVGKFATGSRGGP
jgi:hypothetical protein